MKSATYRDELARFDKSNDQFREIAEYVMSEILKLQVLPGPEGTEDDSPVQGQSTSSYFLCTAQ